MLDSKYLEEINMIAQTFPAIEKQEKPSSEDAFKRRNILIKHQKEMFNEINSTDFKNVSNEVIEKYNIINEFMNFLISSELKNIERGE